MKAMKKFFYPIIAASLILTFSIWGCKKDEFTEEDALQQQIHLINYTDSLERVRDSLNHYGGIINYTVNVVSAGNASFNKSVTTGLDSVQITVSQYGKVVTKTTENGQAIFADLRIGTAVVTVHSDAYTNVDLVVDLTPNPIFPYPTTYAEDTIVGNWYNQVRQASTQVPIFPLTGATLSTIKGVVTYETNLLNNEPEVAEGVEVIGVIDIDDPTFAANFLTTTPGFYAGVIVKIAYSSVVSKTTTDANGEYTLQVPSAADGLPIKVLVSELAEDQTLLLNSKWGEYVFGEQTVRTIFGSDVDGVTTNPSNLPRVAAAYVTFDSPTGTANLQPTVIATATAVISQSGIETIVINNPGSGYTQAPLAVVTGGGGQGASVTPTISNGVVNGFTINNAGSGYSTNPTVTLLYHGDPGAGIQATADVTMGYSVTDYTVTNGGAGYTSAPTVTVNSGAGSGATAQAVMNGYIADLTLTSSGAGYTQAPSVIFENNNGGNGAAATVTMTNQNPIKEILVDPNSTTYFDKATPPTTLTISGAGSGAAATFTMSNAGRVSNTVTMTNIGAGYDPLYPPAVVITGDGFGATADATVNAGGDITVNIITRGQNYTSANISIGAPPAGGTQATATANIEVTVESITVTNGGNGYVNGTTAVQLDGVNFNDVTIYYNMSVQAITLTNVGQDFTGNPTITFVPANGVVTTAATATATVEYQIDDILVVSEGSNYEFNPAHPVVVSITAPPSGGTQATATAIAGNGKVKAVNLLNGGSGYTAAPNVILNGAGYTSEAVISATVSGGAVTGFTINNAGSGYLATPTVSILTYETMATATATAYPTAGQIIDVNITNPGQGYVVAPFVEFQIVNGDGSGTGAEATATLDASGRVTSVTITNPGSGYYTAPSINFVVPNYNLTAEGTANVSTDGHITSVTITNGGEGYVNVPNVTFHASVNGKGTGASGIAQVTNGKVTSVVMTNQGSGYLGKNAYTTFGPGADVAGKAFSLYSPSGTVGTNNGFTVEASKTYIIDIDLGTGLRTVDN